MELPVFIVNAFTADAYGGNPAAIVLVTEFPDTETMEKIAINLSQPMTAFLSSLPQQDPSETSAGFDVRWFAPTGVEIPLCGHATLAAAGVHFFESEPNLISKSIISLGFRSRSGALLTARKDGDWVEIALPSNVATAPPPEVVGRVSVAVKNAIGDDVLVRFVGVGGKGFEHYVLVEVDESCDLGRRKVDSQAFVSINACFFKSISYEETHTALVGACS
jgi:PhzF family phenazine biosynthesis protein